MADQSNYKVTAQLGGLDVPVIHLELTEALSEPFIAQLDLYDADLSWRKLKQGPVAFDALLDAEALITIWDEDKPVRYIHGVIHKLKAGAMGTRRRYFTATIVPHLYALHLTRDCRIFQNLSVEDIVRKLLKEHHVPFHEFQLQKPRVPRAYCVQYEETIFAFIHRLLAEEGIFYHFEHSDGVHKLLFRDQSAALDNIGPLGYQLRSGNKTEPCIWAFDYTEQRVTSETTQRDRTFHNPNYTLQHNHPGLYLDNQRQGRYKTYRYPGRYKKDNQGKPFTQYHQQQLQNQQRVAVLTHDYLHVQEGQCFDLKNHPHEAHNDTWITTRNRLEIDQPQVSHEEAQALFNRGSDPAPQNASRFELTTWAIPYPQSYSPPAWPKPVIEGPQIADVVGPKSSEIFCDKYGRVAVRFPWDRYAKGDHTSSCWIRVAQNWAGAMWGSMAIPRIGHEVVVAYDNGDPDQPIIIGRTYSANNLPPYELAKHMTRMVIKSKTHQGEGHNELYFDDKTNAEEIYIHAQKDQNNIVLNDETTRVDHDRTEKVGHDETITIENNRTEKVVKDETIEIGENRKEKVGKNETIEIGDNRKEKVGKDESIEIGDNQSEKVGKNKTAAIGDDYSIDVGKVMHVKAGDKIILEVGKSKIEMHKDGTVMISGEDITTQAGGEIVTNAKKNVTIKGKKVLNN